MPEPVDTRIVEKFADFCEAVNEIAPRPQAIVVIYVDENGGKPSMLSNTDDADSLVLFCATHTDNSIEGSVPVKGSTH